MSTLSIRTPGRGMHDITADVARIVADGGSGVLHLFIQHTSCSLLVQENADASVRADLLAWLERVAPDGDPLYTHTEEGPDDMSAHLKAAILPTSLMVPFRDGKLLLGVWQAIYLVEHRVRGRERNIVVTRIGG